MAWIETAECSALRTILQNSSAMYLISHTDGRIFWANRAFLDWSKYTLSELTSMSWIDLSVKDEGLTADLEEVRTLDAYSLSYTVQKRYIPKGSSSQLGHLTVMRYPATGEISFCACRWEPFYNGTAKAFESALKSQAEFSAAISILSAQVKAMSSQSVEGRAVESIMQLANKYPKIAWSVFILLVLTVAGNNAVSILNNFGLLGPIKVVEAK